MRDWRNSNLYEDEWQVIRNLFLQFITTTTERTFKHIIFLLPSMHLVQHSTSLFMLSGKNAFGCTVNHACIASFMLICRKLINLKERGGELYDRWFKIPGFEVFQLYEKQQVVNFLRISMWKARCMRGWQRNKNIFFWGRKQISRILDQVQIEKQGNYVEKWCVCKFSAVVINCRNRLRIIFDFSIVISMIRSSSKFDRYLMFRVMMKRSRESKSDSADLFQLYL